MLKMLESQQSAAAFAAILDTVASCAACAATDDPIESFKKSADVIAEGSRTIMKDLSGLDLPGDVHKAAICFDAMLTCGSMVEILPDFLKERFVNELTMAAFSVLLGFMKAYIDIDAENDKEDDDDE